MPVSWEMASGPTVAFKMAGQSSTCSAVEGPKGSNFSNFRVQDTMSRSSINSGEATKGSNYRLPSSNDAVVRGLSALSLRGQYEADSMGDEIGSTSLGALRCGSPDLYRCMSPGNNESSPFSLAPPSVCSKPLGSGSLVRSVDFMQHNIMHTQASTGSVHGGGNLSQMDTSDRMSLNRGCGRALPNSDGCESDGLQRDHSHRVYDSFWSASIQENTHEEDVDLDLTSESSISSENGIPAASSSSGEVLQASDDTEAQSAYKEADNLSCSVGTSFSPRKGLSRFYAGKARSFTCLRDVVSVKDLAKPESPLKKRKVTSGNSRLPPLQKGSAGISKKPLQNCKSTLALAVAMTTKEENELQSSSATSRCQKSLVQSRSYSLSDLHGASGSLFFIG